MDWIKEYQDETGKSAIYEREDPRNAGRTYHESTDDYVNWLEDKLTEAVDSRVLTCAFCGQQYEKGTPTHKAKALTEHIKVCTKHPMRAAEIKIEKLREALQRFVRTSNIAELEAMQFAFRLVPGYDKNMCDVENAVNVLIETK